ncbi:MAG: rhodanese-like domain protein [Arthrobacter sp.]|nr:rhodanese-like domain protein [Arthrobacter sp.]
MTPAARHRTSAAVPVSPDPRENTTGLISSLKKAFSKPYKTISVAEAKELLASGAALIVVRSASAARILAANGYQAYSLRGGMGAWRQAGEPVR